MTGFIVKAWDVTVDGYGTGRYIAKSRGKALAKAWGCDAFSHLTYGAFLKVARCRKGEMGPLEGKQITVGGRPAYFVSNDLQYVQFVRPGSDVVMNSHPYDVEPEEFRPSTYRR
jgi:hypothetical protein